MPWRRRIFVMLDLALDERTILSPRLVNHIDRMILIDSLVGSDASEKITVDGLSICGHPDDLASVRVIVVDGFSVLIHETDGVVRASFCTTCTATGPDMHGDCVVGPGRNATAGTHSLTGTGDRLHCDDVRFFSRAGKG